VAASRQDVIVASATPSGPAPRAVLRFSGPSLATADVLPAWMPPFPGIRAAHSFRLEPLTGVPVEAELLVFPGPFSATGEDVVEVHMPGSPPLVEAVLEQAITAGCRLAEPGEFTRRAFLNGRIDLTQAEAVLELVEARSSAAAVAASEVLGGSLGECMSSCRDVLLEALTELEAGLDFEEGDSQDLQPGEVDTLLQRARSLLQQGLQGESQRMLRHGGRFRIALLGAANAGKTSLFQALTGERSLVSAEAGTTRDRREASWQAPGVDLPLTLIDYPGLGGEAVDERDAAARRLALQDTTPLDLLWLCVAADTDPALLPAGLPAVPRVVIWTKADRGLRPASALHQAVSRLAGPDAPQLALSTPPTHAAIATLAEAARTALAQAEKALTDHIAHGRRHQEALAEALAAVDRAVELEEAGGQQDLLAEELRTALSALALLVGEYTPEEMLDRLFASFCVGK
jgi:tRNA modification GTPase